MPRGRRTGRPRLRRGHRGPAGGQRPVPAALSAQGVLGLRDRHTPGRLEAACATAITVGDPSYRTIKGILIAGTETTANTVQPAHRAAHVPAFLHGPDALFDWSPAGPGLAPVLQLLPDHAGDHVGGNRQVGS